jgi:hypothetical protein
MCGRIFYTDVSAGQSSTAWRRDWRNRNVVPEEDFEDIMDRKEIKEMANTERSLVKTIQIRQMRFMGHVYRKDGIEQLSIRGKIEGRSRGRQRETYVGSLNTLATSKDMNNNELMNASNKRDGWTAMDASACSRKDTLWW